MNRLNAGWICKTYETNLDWGTMKTLVLTLLVFLLICSRAVSADREESKLVIPVNPKPGIVFTDVPAYPNTPAPDAPAPIPPKAKLGAIERWRYESCQKDATQSPTELGVIRGLRLCRDKFSQ